MKIDIQDLQHTIRLDKKKILKCAGFVLKAMEEDNAELSLVFVTDPHIKNLNRKYRNIDSKTDVLAFAMRGKDGISVTSSILGDVVISVDTAKSEAKKRKTSIQKEMDLYLVHGILHLLGYDDGTILSGKKMHLKEQALLKAMSGGAIR